MKIERKINFIGDPVEFETLKRELTLTFSDVGGCSVSRLKNTRQTSDLDDLTHGVVIDLDYQARTISSLDFVRRIRSRFPEAVIIGLSETFDQSAQCEESEKKALAFYHAGIDCGKSISSTSFRLIAEYYRSSTSRLLKPRKIRNIDGFVIDVDQRRLTFNGKTITPTTNEMDLLVALTEIPTAVLSKDALRERVFKNPNMSNDTIDAQFKRLRITLQKIGCSNCIKTVYGIGHCFDSSELRNNRHKPKTAKLAAE